MELAFRFEPELEFENELEFELEYDFKFEFVNSPHAEGVPRRPLEGYGQIPRWPASDDVCDDGGVCDDDGGVVCDDVVQPETLSDDYEDNHHGDGLQDEKIYSYKSLDIHPSRRSLTNEETVADDLESWKSVKICMCIPI